ncbi:MAG: VOC family protein [Anaerolineales bacterium]|nr:VOC family protein [Anaerolineales bacterium]
MSHLSIQATNAFFYYQDVEKAWAFYRDVMGLETAVDYGFAKIMRVAHNSYLTLVDVASGMHSADEPKSVAIALVTEQVEGWYDYLTRLGVPIRNPYQRREGSAHDGFVAFDPEGYYLEIERFNLHPENETLLPILAALPPTYSVGGTRPPELEIRATVLWLYYNNLARAEQFYESLLGINLLVDQGWAKVYQVTGSSFLGPVSGEKGMHPATEQKAVTVSFFTADVNGWFAHATAQPGFRLRTPAVTDESNLVHIFVGYDPEGYFLEWDTFLPLPPNERLLQLLAQP